MTIIDMKGDTKPEEFVWSINKEVINQFEDFSKRMEAIREYMFTGKTDKWQTLNQGSSKK